MRDDLARAVEFVHAARKLAERNQMAADIADLIFVRLANVENVDIVAAIEPRFQLARSDFRNGRRRRRSLLAANAAEFRVVDQLGDGWMVAANRAFGILAQLQLAELHAERVEQQQAGRSAARPCR